MKVLIGVDGSQESMTALQTAIRLLWPPGRRLDILLVAPGVPGRGRSSQAGWERQRGRLLEEGRRRLSEETAARLAAGTPDVNYLVEIGSPAGVIVNRASDYDIVVIGAKGAGTPGEFGLGPVASRVVEHAPVPVLVGRAPRSEEGVRVLAAVDGSDASLAAVETLDSLLDLNSAEICLMHVVETPWLHLAPQEDSVNSSEGDVDSLDEGRMEEELNREGEEAMEQARKRLRNSRASVSERIEQGNPANEILSEAERGQYDLVVLGGSGSRDLKHSMLGSVSFKVAWNAPCSVLVVREPEQDAGRLP